MNGLKSFYLLVVTGIYSLVLPLVSADFTSFSLPSGFGGVSLTDQSSNILSGHDNDPALGVFVQLLWDVNSDGADIAVGDLQGGGNGNGASSTDIVVSATWLGRDSAAAMIGVSDGWLPGLVFNSKAAGQPDDADYYVRVWNLPSPSFNLTNPELSEAPNGAGVFVGVSGLFRDNHTSNGGGPNPLPGSFDFAPAGLQTTLSVPSGPLPLKIVGLQKDLIGTGWVVTWHSTAGRSYFLELDDDLSFTGATSLGPFSATGSTHMAPFTGDSLLEYLRVVEQ